MSLGFDALVTEAERAPITGWDFSWLNGRATEARPSWHYSERVAERAATAHRMLELECGDGTLAAAIPRRPDLLVAVEAYKPNLALAATRLPNVIAASADALPLRDNSFDLATCRHPIVARWSEIARVLEPGGVYFAQHVGPRSVAELSDFMLGPQSHSDARDPDKARIDAINAGLEVTDLRSEQLPMTFDDIGAVVYFLRLVVWIVPGFTVERFRDRLRALYDQIEIDGPFRATSTRFLIEARKPPRAWEPSRVATR